MTEEIVEVPDFLCPKCGAKHFGEMLGMRPTPQQVESIKASHSVRFGGMVPSACEGCFKKMFPDKFKKVDELNAIIKDQ